MGWIRRFKLNLPNFVSPVKKPVTDESGIALFMVIAAMTVLSVVVTEFTYVAQVNARSTADSSDQIKAHYLAKTGFKLSLLRLRAFKVLKELGKKGGGMPEIPKFVLDQIWGFPFFYPIPSGVPGLTVAMKDEIEKFQTETTLPGKFSATIESESNKISINSLIKSMAPTPIAADGPKPAGNASGNDGTKPATPAAAGTVGPKKDANKYDVEEARKGFKDFLAKLLEEKTKKDPDFADQYRDLDIEELYDNILGWVDFSYQPKNMGSHQPLPYKREPFYSMTELHMVRPIDDGLYDLIAPNFTPFSTAGVNVNKIREPMLRVLLSGITDEEVTEFFKFRDDPEADNTFKSADEFYKWVGGNVGVMRGSTRSDDLKANLAKRGIQLVTDEEIFKITVVAEVNKATRILEAWVLVASSKDEAKAKPAAPTDGNPFEQHPDPNGPTTGPAAKPNAAGLRILYMRES
ncbi:MAG: general secretion pathway protein GspK [Cryobacterium sp.]|nr:general secretion pathway protein GspK [Oligoflexia bacterium]